MKYPINTLVITGAIALTVLVLSGATVQQSGMSCCGEMVAQGPSKPVLAKQLKNKQTSTILINGGYSPSTIQVSAGKPVELTFTGGKNIGCGGTVVFKSLKISKDVTTGKSVVIKFTPKSKGVIPFTCGMGMFKGTVIVK